MSDGLETGAETQSIKGEFCTIQSTVLYTCILDGGPDLTGGPVKSPHPAVAVARLNCSDCIIPLLLSAWKIDHRNKCVLMRVLP